MQKTKSCAAAASSLCDVELLCEEGVSLFYQGEIDKSVEIFNQVINRSAYHLRAHIFKGHCYMFRKDYNNALIEYRKSHKINPDCHSLYFYAGQCYYSMKRWDEAYYYLGLLKETEIIEDSRIERLLFEGRRINEVKENLREKCCLRLRSDYDFFRRSLKRINEYIDYKFFRRALNLIDILEECFPKNHKLLYYKGLIYSREGKWEFAEKCFQQSYELNKKSVEPLLALIGISVRTRKVQRVREYCYQALKIDPENPFVKEQLEELNRERRLSEIRELSSVS